MKKFKFKQANLGEVLSREELKLITGGSDVDSSQYRCSGISPEHEHVCDSKSSGEPCSYSYGFLGSVKTGYGICSKRGSCPGMFCD